MEIRIWASIFSYGSQSMGIINCSSSKEWHLGFSNNAAGPLRWLMTSSLLFQQVDTRGEGRLPPALPDNQPCKKIGKRSFPSEGPWIDYMCWDNDPLSLRVVGSSKQITSGPEKPLQFMCMCHTDVIFCACPDMEKVGKVGYSAVSKLASKSQGKGSQVIRWIKKNQII